MSAERDVNRIVRSWIRTEGHESADRVLQTVLSKLDATPQRRSWWPSRRFANMNRLVLLAGAAAAVLVVAILGYNLLPRGGPDVGNASPLPTVASTPSSNPTPSPAGSQGPWVLQSGQLVAHAYYTRPLLPPHDGMTFTFDIPEGWFGFAPSGAFPAGGTEGPTGAGFGIGMVDRLFRDPCKPNAGDVTLGPTVDDLAAALQEPTAYEASTPVDVELGGYTGKRLDLQLPLEFACSREEFRPWEVGIYAQGPGDRWHLWILEVEGVRVVVLARDFAATPAAVQAELQAVVDSLQITP